MDSKQTEQNKATKATVRISTALLGKLKDEQYSLRKRGLREKNYDELLDEAWEIAHGKQMQTKAHGSVSE